MSDVIYQEESGSTFTSDGVNYDLNKIFKAVAKEPIGSIAVSKIKWVLDYATPDVSRVDKADLDAPILVTLYQRKELVVDGLHRLAKAVKEKKTHLPFRRVSERIMQETVINQKQHMTNVTTVDRNGLTSIQEKAFEKVIWEAIKHDFLHSTNEAELFGKRSCIVVLDNNVPVGFYTPKQQTIDFIQYWRAGTLFLCKKAEGKGIMHTVLKEFFATHHPGLAWILDSNDRSINLFMSLGFTRGKFKASQEGEPAHWWTLPASKLEVESIHHPIYTNW